ncbi:Phosphoenolpyruvate-dihydroxyacetone phosphotransferase, subunit DhaM; DHA-specific IIA component / DHA-specific phosphocarrier protein HPr [Arthrobacter sp. 9AX]|uniref:dihydroxyacetone kinase phosphoryl donor subunit DhaM n=1 Tax=Arthrobacter sp. 9AX TaxID=2653131 RepID=UPI0012F23897|nr:dihydroxyacetone kinase phosphoryl donor subunit DhaM [Arthrobacter sp. 9AX]VXB89739.1 Phosphoenolpyruvate-dihydroxyacetone phosphotransferase, subunit DhaM; DHA-specific IIA component / DHA-specific phosphocarrier protein HPr [Arthrobacter sp. 9AX]
MTVSIVVVSHSEKIADGAAELAAQMAPDVLILPAGGTSDGRIGTSLEKVMAALDQLSNGGGAVVLADLGSAVMTAESALDLVDNPADVVLADAPLVEGLVAAAVAAQGGGDVQAVKRAAEAVRGPARHPESTAVQEVAEGSVTGSGPDFTGDFELINEAGMHARPAAKIAGGLASLDAEVQVNGVDATSMTALMTLAAGKGSVLHIEAWGVDAERAVNYVGGLVQAGFGEP